MKQSLYELLAASKDPSLAKRALNLALGDEPGLTTSAAMIGQVASYHPDMAFDFALANIAKVNERVDATSRSRFFPSLADASSNPEMITKLNAYGSAHLDPSARGELETVINAIEYRMKLKRERAPEIRAWLDRQTN